MKKKRTGLNIFASFLAVLLVAGTVYCSFGGFGTGECAYVEEFARYSSGIDEITIPEGTRAVALGEATHGSKEFQELKLDVFKLLVEKYGVRAFALEGDFGGCEFVNRYIHGEAGTARDAAEAIGFSIYRTEEMAELIDWMREFNETADEAEQLRFYGFDMQRIEFNYRYLISGAKALGADTAELEALWGDSQLDSHFTPSDRASALERLRSQLLCCGDQAAFALHHADVLLQNIALGKAYADPDASVGTALRDRLMAENVLWILEQEEMLGNECIFITGHNGHIERNGTYYSMEDKVTGHYLSDELGSAYFAIGTDFFHAGVNLPNSSQKRISRSFYSHDSVAKAAKKCGNEMRYLDFSAIPQDSPLKKSVEDYGYMGSLGESYLFIMKLVPYSYRVWRSPALTFDAVIYVPYAHASVIWDME